MTGVWIIAVNTWREIIRDRILYGLVVFALLFIGLSLILGQLTFAEQARLSIDLGLAGMQISAVILSIFVGSNLVSKELDKRTVLTLLVRPTSRTQFLIAKFLGMSLVLLAVISGLAVVMALVLAQLEVSIGGVFVTALSGIYFESLVLLGLSIFFGCFMRPFLTVSTVVGLFLIGHWLTDLSFFASKSESALFQIFAKITTRALPNLERFNWRSNVTYDEVVSLQVWSWSLLYTISWVIILLAAASLIFRRRDLA